MSTAKLSEISAPPMASSARKYQRSRSPPKRGSKPSAALPLIKNLVYSPPNITNGPVKTWTLSIQGKPVEVDLMNVYSPFAPSSLVEESTRLTLTLRLPSEWDSVFDCFEAALCDEMLQSGRVVDLFGRDDVSAEDLEAWYKPITKKVGDYPRTLRVKCNTQGPYRTRYWGADKQALDRPSEHIGKLFNARVVLRGVWVGENAFGLVADCTDLQLVEEFQAVCPFPSC